MENRLERYNHLWSRINAAYHDAALRLGLSDSAMMILYTICEQGGECPLGDIMRMTSLSKQTVHSSLRGLAEDGFVRLETMGGKAKKAVLTDDGRGLASRTVLRVMRIENEILDSWTEEELRVYMELTQRFHDEFRKKSKEL